MSFKSISITRKPSFGVTVSQFCRILKIDRQWMLDNDKFGPGNRPYWEMKEGRAQFRYPDLIKALRSESDPGRRRQILAGYKTRIFGSSRGTVRAQGASQ